MHAALAPRGPDGDGIWLDGTRRDGAPAAGDHRPLRAGRPADARRGARPRRRLQRLHLQPPASCAPSSRGSATPSARPPTPRSSCAAGASGARACWTGSRACSRSPCWRPSSGRCVLVRDRLGIKPLYLAELPGGGLRAASTLPALLAAGGVDTNVDPVALHHYLSWHSVVPAPRTILNGVRKLAPATVLDGRARRPPPRAGVLEPAARARRRRALARRSGATRCWTRCASPCGGGWSPTCPVGVLLSGGLDSSLIVALLAEQGQRGLATFSIGFPDAGGREGNEFAFSDLVAERVRDRPPPDPRRDGRARGGAPAGDRRDERADGLPRLRRVLAARAGGQPRAQGRAVRPGRRRGARRLQLVPAAAGRAGQRARRLRGGVLRPRPRRRRASSPPRPRARTSRARSPPSGSSAPAPPRRSTARCGWTRGSCSSTTRSSAWTT